MSEKIRERYPRQQDIPAVFSVVATMVYGWTLVIFFFKLPSWLLFVTTGELFALLVYIFIIPFFESLIIMGFLLAICLFLPARFFRNDFVVRASWLVICGYTSIFLFLKLNTMLENHPIHLWEYWSITTFIICLIAAWISPRIKFMRAFAEWASDRLQVFLFILIPISLISLVVVVFRNIN